VVERSLPGTLRQFQTRVHERSAELWFQPIGYRWALNLDEYETFETDRFIRYYRDMAASFAMVVAAVSTVVE